MASRGLVIGGVVVAALGGLALMAGSASASPGPVPPPPPPRRTPAEMAAQLKAHPDYQNWRQAHNFCLNPPSPDPNDPNSINVIAKAHSDACTFADVTWNKMTTDLNIPRDDWDAVEAEL